MTPREYFEQEGPFLCGCPIPISHVIGVCLSLRFDALTELEQRQIEFAVATASQTETESPARADGENLTTG